MPLLEPRAAFKPLEYPWCLECCTLQNRIHWMPEDVPLGDDVRDWNSKLTAEDRNLLTQIFRFFTQADIAVADCYMEKYSRIFKPPEVKMMLSSFSAMESIHIMAYSHLLDTIGMPEIEYSAFLNYKAMKDKYDYAESFSVDSKFEVAKTLAAFGAFTEGMQLYSSFAMLLNFPRFGKMKGMGQIITYSVRDESLHFESIINLFHTFINENPEVWTVELQESLIDIASNMVTHEDAFIDLAFEMGSIEGLTKEDLKKYIRYIADKRMLQLRMRPLFKVTKNPLPWLDEMLNAVEFSNFFETRASEYSKASTSGQWGDVWNNLDQEHTL